MPTLVVQPEGRGEIVATMSTEPIELEPIEVTTTASTAYLRRVGFEERRARGFGNQFTREDVEDWAFREMSDLIARSHGIIVVGGVGVPPVAFSVDNRAQSLLGGTCILPIFLDGVRLTSSDLNQGALWSARVEAVEVYTGNDVPVQFGGTNPCGVVLVWTRH